MTENTVGTTAFNNPQKKMRSFFGRICRTAAVMIAFAFVCRHVTLREEKTMWGLDNVS
jgi:hypothetical protein